MTTITHQARTSRAQAILQAILPVALERGVDVRGQRWFVQVPFAITMSGLSRGSLHRLDVRCGSLVMRVQWDDSGALQVGYLWRDPWEAGLIEVLGVAQV